MDKIGVGIVGLGMALKPHALALRDLAEQVDFAGGYSPSAERRQAFVREYGLAAVERLDDLLGNPRVGALLILTPPRTHADLALQAASAGKHVLLEKPIDVDWSSANRIVEQLAAAKRRLGVVLQFRFRPGVPELRQLIGDGALGELLSVSASIRWWRPASYFAQAGRGSLARDGGGVLLTQAIHTLDLMLHLAGPVQEVSALCRSSGLRAIDTEDLACAAVRFASGAIGAIDATTVAYPCFAERIELAGTRGSAVIEGDHVRVFRSGQDHLVFAGAGAGGGGADPMAFSHQPHKRLIEDFLAAVREQREPYCNGASVLPVHALIDGMLESARRGAAVRLAT